jgi:hypothetical protein
MERTIPGLEYASLSGVVDASFICVLAVSGLFWRVLEGFGGFWRVLEDSHARKIAPS